MADTFDDQRIREHIEVLVLAIGAIHRHAAPEPGVLDAIIQQEVDRATNTAHPGTRMLDPDTVTRLVPALERWREAEADRRGGVSDANQAPERSG